MLVTSWFGWFYDAVWKFVFEARHVDSKLTLGMNRNNMWSFVLLKAATINYFDSQIIIMFLKHWIMLRALILYFEQSLKWSTKKQKTCAYKKILSLPNQTMFIMDEFNWVVIICQ